MGKTVPSYRMTVEFEISRWKGFRNALENEEEKQAFDQIMDMCRGLASAGSAACSPIIFEPMAMSILVSQQKKMQQLENELNDLLYRLSEGQSHG
jgi:C4-type Zn-finger protein